jgi:hypothetical protein
LSVRITLRKVVPTRAVPARRSGNMLAILQPHTDQIHCGRVTLRCRLHKPSEPAEHVRLTRPENHASNLLAMILGPTCQLVLGLGFAAMSGCHQNPTGHVHAKNHHGEDTNRNRNADKKSLPPAPSEDQRNGQERRGPDTE